jgi:uncharacterized membrane protein
VLALSLISTLLNDLRNVSAAMKGSLCGQAAASHGLDAEGGRRTAVRRQLFMTVTTRAGISDNAASAIAYFTFFPAIVFLLVTPYKDSPYVRFHAWQSVLLDIAAFLVEIVIGSVALLTLFLGSVALVYSLRLLSLLWLVLWLACVIQAMNGKRFKIPVLGSIAEKLSMK